jgi:SAGA-associated factor 29
MVGGDKFRYEVKDADDGTVWTTTLKSIILLPDPEASPTVSSHPSNLEDIPKGSQVLGLYPDTTSFYRATVVSAPLPGTGMGRGPRGGSGRVDPGAKPGVYRLSFVDDGDNISDVAKDLVVLVSERY